MAGTDITGKTDVCKWQDGKQAVFLLEFDDSLVSHIDHAIPELIKRDLIGTFYINPGQKKYKSQQLEWRTEVKAAGMVLANHTYTHIGALSVDAWDRELALCNEEIARCCPNLPMPRLISYAKPGGLPSDHWLLSDEEMAASLKKHNLIERPRFWGPPFEGNSVEELYAVIDQAVISGEMGHIDFHGVGGDWHVVPMDLFTAVLDKLVERRSELWITDPISWHQYATERETARVNVVKANERGIQLRLTCNADPTLYDLPLTLITRVPDTWSACTVSQGKTTCEVAVIDGTLQYTAVPTGAIIHLTPVSEKTRP